MRNGLIVDKDGTKRWFLNDKLHRLDGPAIERVDGHKSWWVFDKRHRTDGPAVEWADGSKEWWFEDECLGDDQKGFWALWDKLTPEEQNNLTLLQYMTGAK